MVAKVYISRIYRMSNKSDVSNYPKAIIRAIRDISLGKGISGQVKEVSDQLRRDMHGSDLQFKFENPDSFLVPFDRFLQRDLIVGSFASAGALASDLRADFVPGVFTNISAVARAGAQFVTGLKGSLQIPRETTKFSLTWLPEIATITASDPAVGQIVLAPKRLGGACVFSQQLNVESDGLAEKFLRESIGRAVGEAIDKGALVGSGSAGEPVGVFTAAATSTISFAATATLAKALAFRRKLDDLNIPVENQSFIASADTAEKWRQIEKSSGSGRYLWENERVVDLPAQVTNSLTTGSLIAGDFSQCLTVFFGTGIEIVVDRFSRSLQHKISVVANVLCDTCALRPTVFVRNSGSAAQ